MNQDDKMRSAITTLIAHASRVTTLERDLADAIRRRETAKGDIIRVLKALGHRQVLFRGRVYTLGTMSPATSTEPGVEFLTINKFTGVVLPDGSSPDVQGPAKAE